MNITEPRSTRIAVFIDFDNVEIGVKNTIGGQFDIGLVLEAIKERGEIVTKIAYSDWKRAGDYSRHLTQHAIRMVQRNMTPGGDKNGADITMALDALEMCFTHDHINAFVIVGGDSDFISLVEKLKQYGRKVIVVGGRYENLVPTRHSTGRGGGRGGDKGGRPASGATSDMAKVLPLIKRALKVLSDKEVTPQLGLLKSTLLQLDSTFSEREYGASSFRDFMEKVAQTGVVTQKQAGRSMLVEVNDGTLEDAVDAGTVDVPHDSPAPQAAAPHTPADGSDEDAPPASMSMQEGIRAVQQAFAGNARWPMYVRQAKQVLRTAIEGFDERKYGFQSIVDLLRAAGKDGVLRIERDRQGAIRVFPGAGLAQQGTEATGGAPAVHVDDAQEQVTVDGFVEAVEIGNTVEAVDEPPIDDGEVAMGAGIPPEEQERQAVTRVRKGTSRVAKPKAVPKTAKPAAARARKAPRRKKADD
jgi:uncharacterized LabA/DUF88 family protein